MAARVRVEVKRGAVIELTYQQPLTQMLYRKAQAVLEAARSSAPVDSGTYARSFVIRWATTDRNVVRVHNTAPYAAGVEFGGSSSTRRRTLGRAVEAGGAS